MCVTGLLLLVVSRMLPLQMANLKSDEEQAAQMLASNKQKALQVAPRLRTYALH